jgi:hypothetical protein
MKKNISLTFIMIFLCSLLHAQTLDEIQTLLKTSAVSYAQAVRFVLEAADVTGAYDKTSEQDAIRFALENKWLPKNTDAQETITLENFSYLVMKAFGLKGGPMYTLFNNAHYSYREMVYRELIQGRSDPKMKVSGYTMILIVNRLLFRLENDPWKIPEHSVGTTAAGTTSAETPAGLADGNQ